MRHVCSTNLLRAMLDKSPFRDVRGNACLALAAIFKDAAAFGTNKLATAEAERLYQRVIAEFWWQSARFDFSLHIGLQLLPV